jgi:restriction endonuclease Mrr
MLPLLNRLADGQEHKHSKLIDELGSELGLTDEELSKLLPSGTQKVFANRVGWARTYLGKAGLLDSPKRGFQQITERGRTVLSQGLEQKVSSPRVRLSSATCSSLKRSVSPPQCIREPASALRRAVRLVGKL